MNLTTFTLAVMSKATEGPIGRIVDNVTPGTAHAVGVGSGITGLALWAEAARHLTTFVGLIVAVVALIGGAFYALYWAVKAIREIKELRKKS